MQREEQGMAARFKFKSIRNGCLLGMYLIQPDGHYRPVAEVIMPMDGDWRADVDFYDELERAYRSRLNKAIGQGEEPYQPY